MIFLLHFSFVFDSLTFFALQGIRLSSGSDLAWAEISSNAGLSRHDARAVACEHWRMIADRQGAPLQNQNPPTIRSELRKRPYRTGLRSERNPRGVFF